jgi:hypothetical protein
MEPDALNYVLNAGASLLYRHPITGLLIAFGFGYLVREIISRYRRKKFRRRHPS